jgi:hypothetical protein
MLAYVCERFVPGAALRRSEQNAWRVPEFDKAQTAAYRSIFPRLETE